MRIMNTADADVNCRLLPERAYNEDPTFDAQRVLTGPLVLALPGCGKATWRSTRWHAMKNPPESEQEETEEDLDVPIEDILISPEPVSKEDPGPDLGMYPVEDMVRDVERPVPSIDPPSNTPVFAVEGPTRGFTRGIYSGRNSAGRARAAWRRSAWGRGLCAPPPLRHKTCRLSEQDGGTVFPAPHLVAQSFPRPSRWHSLSSLCFMEPRMNADKRSRETCHR